MSLLQIVTKIGGAMKFNLNAVEMLLLVVWGLGSNRCSFSILVCEQNNHFAILFLFLHKYYR
jgi:hypothetical protein